MTETAPPTRLWGGRFSGGPADALSRLSMSVHFDWRLAPYDLLASRSHARVLHRAGLLDDHELQRVLVALDELDHDARHGLFRPSPEDEDVHTALEQAPLQGSVDVLVLRRRSEDPVPRIVVELVERAQDPLGLVVVEQAGAVQHPGVCPRREQVVRRQPPVELHAHG